ncbi:hypothetical protein GCM10011571_00430 [Marinithermofilum abyssi]|uniref:NlpC/P60 domain-containing protein n=1 Tax=Marinithermofilum abyssi TaxID=1571185 RepID=A0A8J2YBH7_9BACL|nr:C40 family peptidase [Marinithermofilum abyssi]GGE03480.1 hypothetical protein GCM10011571_00430 [Marinithermofilum abyssi]
MRTNHKWKKVVVASAALLMSTSILPLTGQADAAAKPVTSSQAYSIVDSIFGKVGLENPLKSQNTQNTQNTQDTQNIGVKKASAASEESNTWGDKIIATGEKYLGTPYKFGSPSTTTKTFDCSSFTQRVFAENGIKLPRTAEPQAEVGKEVSRDQLQKGDLVFFKLKGKEHLYIEHVGIYAGNGKVLHTWGPGGVRYDDMSDRWLDWGFVKATRVTPETVNQ